MKGHLGGPSCTEAEERAGRGKLVWRPVRGACRLVVRAEVPSQASSGLLVGVLEGREGLGLATVD